MQIIQAKLSELKIDPANVRQTDKAPDEGLLSSLREKGLLVPLTVRKNGDGYLVTDGGMRLAALNLLAKDGNIDKATPVPCVVRDDDAAEAADTSLTTNFIRTAMHPVDEYEAFAKLVEGGKQPEQIAKGYGLPLKIVTQSLALGRLAPEVLQAWRTDDLDEEVAQAFTLEPDQKRQATLLAQLRKKHGLNAWTVKQAIVGEARQAEAMVKFVGLDAYKEAGGATAQDLFTDSKDPALLATDLQLLTKLYEQKIKDKIVELKADGWKWVEMQSDLPQSAQWWDSKAKSSIKAADRGEYGVIIAKHYHGDIEIRYGVMKPAAAKAKAKTKAKADGKEPEVAISAALCGRISQTVTDAAVVVLNTDPALALAVIAASILTMSGSPSDIRSGRALLENDDYDDDFAHTFELMRKKKPADLHQVLADLAAQSLGLGGQGMSSLPLADGQDADAGLLESLDGKKLNHELRQRFNAADYFAGVTAQTCRDAITLCDPKYPFTGKEKKSELAKLAAELVVKSNAGGKAGYLPPEMRTKSYDGPQTKKATPAPKTKTAKAKPAKVAKKRAA